MIAALIILIVLIILAVLFILSMAVRNGHPKLQSLHGYAYAHRGLHGDGAPENSMEAFRRALECGYGIELDVHLMKDGKLAVIHDSSLLRTAGVDIPIEDLTAEDLPNYRLEGTDERIPLYSEVLELYAGKAPIILELKPVGSNVAALTEAACKMMDSYQGAYCMESFDPRCIHWLKKHRPDIIRGQLAENYFAGTKAKIPAYLKLVLANHMLNFMTKPDFIAYRYSDRNLWTTKLCRSLWNPESVSWTLKTQEEYDTAVKEGWLPIFEGFRP